MILHGTWVSKFSYTCQMLLNTDCTHQNNHKGFFPTEWADSSRFKYDVREKDSVCCCFTALNKEWVNILLPAKQNNLGNWGWRSLWVRCSTMASIFWPHTNFTFIASRSPFFFSHTSPARSHFRLPPSSHKHTHQCSHGNHVRCSSVSG